jgi:hypothetical protein
MFTALLFSCLALPHPFHVSVAEAQWNLAGQRLQVALRLSPRDLDAALSNVTGRRIVLEKESPEETKRLVEAYLRGVIYLADNPHPPAASADTSELQDRFHWVGIQDEVRYVWVYFELQKPEGADKLWLHNRVFFETERTQINTLQLMKTDPAIAVRTNIEQPSGPIPVVIPPRETVTQPAD